MAFHKNRPLPFEQGPESIHRHWMHEGKGLMKTVDIIGGIGPESTIEYYRLMLSAWREHRPDGSAPSIVINSIDMQKMLGMIEAGEIAGVVDYLVEEVGRLQKAGAHFGLLAANTPHVAFDKIRRRSALPLLSIVEAACDTAQAMGLKRLGLFGTRFTMQGRFYPDVFSRAGIALIMPDPDQQSYIHAKYMGELLRGVFLAETQKGLLAIADHMQEREARG